MAETIGSLVDKISIIELKIHHMGKQIQRSDATPDHRVACSHRLKILKEQSEDLLFELNDLMNDVLQGKKVLKVYRQFKMYNDPLYRSNKASS